MCFSNRINNTRTITIRTDMSQPCRPYTEYNLFFQLEREHILQIQLGFEPDYEPQDVFDPSDTTNYQGPPLPSRYNDLILLKDWHLPGKEKRRKRRHRKTHGKIGFRELSLKIAEAWKNIDSETRQFCSDLCDVGLTQYKYAMLAQKTDYNENEFITSASYDDNKFELEPSLSAYDIGPPTGMFVPTDQCSLAEVDAAFENDLNLSMENIHESMSDITASSHRTSLRSSIDGSFADSMVDIDDDIIIEMYKSVPIEAIQEEATGSTAVVSNFSSSPNAAPPSLMYKSVPIETIQEEATGSATVVSNFSSSPNAAPPSFDPYGKNSYIDSTLNDIKTMRKAILDQQIQMQSSIMAARRLTKGLQNQGRRGNQMMNGFTARSA